MSDNTALLEQINDSLRRIEDALHGDNRAPGLMARQGLIEDQLARFQDAVEKRFTGLPCGQHAERIDALTAQNRVALLVYGLLVLLGSTLFSAAVQWGLRKAMH